jgi:hypothetical protein
VFRLGDVGPAGGGVEVGVGDRFALDPGLLALHRHRDLLLLGGDVLAQPGPAPLAGLGADGQLLLGAGHGLVAGPAGPVVAGLPAGGQVDILGGACLGRRVGVAGAIVQAVVAPQLLLFGLRQVPVGIHPRRVLDQLLLIRHLHLIARRGRLGDGHEGRLGAEQPGVDQGPLRLAGLVVDIDGLDGADPVAVAVDQGGALPAPHGVDVRHLPAPFCVTAVSCRLGLGSSWPAARHPWARCYRSRRKRDLLPVSTLSETAVAPSGAGTVVS